MREFVKLQDPEAILKVLEDFSDIFPHLHEKIDSMESYAQKLSRNAEFYLGVESGNVFGIAVFYANDHQTATAYISLIGVKQTVQKSGFGFWLLTQCMDQAKALGMNRISLEVDCDNQNAIAFYERNGFSISDKTDRNSMYMSRNL